MDLLPLFFVVSTETIRSTHQNDVGRTKNARRNGFDRHVEKSDDFSHLKSRNVKNRKKRTWTVELEKKDDIRFNISLAFAWAVARMLNATEKRENVLA